MTDTKTQPHTCGTCGTEYPSFARYTRTDPCYKASQARRFGSDDTFTADDATRTSEDGGHYGTPSVEAQDFEPGQGGAQNSSGGKGSIFATPKQIAYLTALATERGLNDFEQRGIDLATTLKQDVSDWIDQMLAMSKPATAAPATRKPNRYAARCINCGAQVPAEGGYLAKDAAGKWAAEHVACPAQPVAQAPAYEPQRGDVHVIDGEFYRVHVSQGSGRTYAARFDGHRFDYERGAITKVTADNKVTAAQAAEFGHMHGACVFCSRAIDTPESTAVGYGPVCAERHGLPWGE